MRKWDKQTFYIERYRVSEWKWVQHVIQYTQLVARVSFLKSLISQFDYVFCLLMLMLLLGGLSELTWTAAGTCHVKRVVGVVSGGKWVAGETSLFLWAGGDWGGVTKVVGLKEPKLTSENLQRKKERKKKALSCLLRPKAKRKKCKKAWVQNLRFVQILKKLVH